MHFCSFMEMCFYVVPLLVAVVISFISSMSRGTAVDVVSDSILLLDALYMCAMILVFGTFPRLATDTMREAAWSLLYLLFALPAPLSLGIVNHYVNSVFTILAHLFLNVANPNSRTTLPLNGVCAAWQLFKIATTPALQMQPLSNGLIVFVSFTFNIIVAAYASHLMRAEAAADVRDEEARSTLENLLRSMCDSLVLLRQDQSFSELSGTLCGILRCEKAPDGPFLDLVAEGDKKRFEDFITCDAEMAAHVIHVDLLAKSGQIPVKVFRARAGDSTDSHKVMHLLGLVEDVHDPQAQPERAQEDDGQVQEEKSFDIGDQTDGRELVEWKTTSDEGEEVTLTIRTRLQIELVSGSETCNQLGLSKDVEFEQILARFRRSQYMLRWFEFLHTMAACGLEHERFDAGKVGFLDATLQKEFRGKLRAVLLPAPEKPTADGDPEVSGKWEDFGPEIQSAHFQLKLRPPSPAATQGDEPALRQLRRLPL